MTNFAEATKAAPATREELLPVTAGQPRISGRFSIDRPHVFSDPDAGKVESPYHIEKRGRFFAVMRDRHLICICVYRKGANALIELLS
jgi:hypothetical protein